MFWHTDLIFNKTGWHICSLSSDIECQNMYMSVRSGVNKNSRHTMTESFDILSWNSWYSNDIGSFDVIIMKQLTYSDRKFWHFIMKQLTLEWHTEFWHCNNEIDFWHFCNETADIQWHRKFWHFYNETADIDNFAMFIMKKTNI